MKTVSLQEFSKLAKQAFRWTSFDPDGVAKITLQEFEKQLNKDLQSIPEIERRRYVENYIRYFTSWLYAFSNCASPAITGRSKFNVYKAQKTNNIEQKRYKAFIKWREKTLKEINRKIEEGKSEYQKFIEKWEKLKDDILYNAEAIHEINTGKKIGFDKAGFVSSIYNKVERYARRGDVEIVKLAVQFIKEFNQRKGIVITDRHKFFKLLKVAEKNKKL